MSRRLVAVVLVSMALPVSLLAGGVARAQDVSLPVTPDPSQCTVTLTPDQMRALLAATPPAETTPTVAADASPTAFALPEGDPADETTITAVTETTIQLLACINGRNTLGFYSLISPESVRRQLAAQRATESDLAAVFARTPTPAAVDAWATLLAVREVRVLADGRVAALVDSHFPNEEPDVQTDLFYFLRQDGRWYVDDIVEDLEDRFPATAGSRNA
jgi:hypothetical protein